ncbi:MAG: hypothetical protein ACHQZS_01830 [Candidatus Binatales bacterium]
MPRNCIILGSGRSGTSLASGILAKAGYFMGDAIWPANEGNPKGQFEDEEVNGINEELLAQVVPLPTDGFIRRLRLRSRPLAGFQRWLAALPLGVSIRCSPDLARRIEAVTARAPYCFKDPRFCYTLAAWRPYIRDALLLCVFRHPSVTAGSIVKECERADYLRDVQMDVAGAFKVWESMYRYVLDIHYPQGGDWLFVHYDQLLEGTAFPALGAKLGIRLDREFADRRLKRSKAAVEAPSRALTIYRRLCHLADYAP